SLSWPLTVLLKTLQASARSIAQICALQRRKVHLSTRIVAGWVLGLGQVPVTILGIPRAGPFLDDDFDGLALVLVEHVIDAAGGGGTHVPAAPALPRERDDHQDDCHRPDNRGYRPG